MLLYSGYGGDILGVVGLCLAPYPTVIARDLVPHYITQQRGVNTVAALDETMWMLTIGHLEIRLRQGKKPPY